MSLTIHEYSLIAPMYCIVLLCTEAVVPWQSAVNYTLAVILSAKCVVCCVSSLQGASGTAQSGFSLLEALGCHDAGSIFLHLSTPESPGHHKLVPYLDGWSSLPVICQLTFAWPLFCEHVTTSSSSVGIISLLDIKQDNNGDTFCSFPIRP